MKKKINWNLVKRKLNKFKKENKIYCYGNIVLFVLILIIMIFMFRLGFLFLIIDLVLNLILIETGGIKMIQTKGKDNIKESDYNEEENMAKGKKANKKKRNKLKKAIFNILLFVLLIALIVSVLFAIYIVIKAPEFNPNNLYRAESSIVYDKSGKQIAKLGVEKRKKVSYNQLPQVLVDAIIATEDSRYMQHNGFDAPRFFKASIGQVVNKITRHGNAGGGSTLTMQVSKNNYTSVESSGFEGIVRKFTDIYMSIFKLEKSYSKEQIMEFYVNTPYLGNSSYGVEQACQGYFGKSVSDINLAEASLIAGLFQAPSSYDPYRYPEMAEKRRSTVLYLMRKHGYITEEEEKVAKSIPISSLLKNTNADNGSNPYQAYIDVVIDEVEEKTGKNPYTNGMKIYSNLDTSKQDVLNKIMSGETWNWKDEKINSGVAVVDVNNGALVAVGGGRNQEGERQFNYATMIKRQIGSCAKPLFDYGPAYEYNGASEATQVLDAPYSYSDGSKIKNADGGYGGLMTYKYAMAASRNIPAVKVFQSVENSKIVEFVTRLGLTPEIDSNGGIHEAHALGAFDGTSPTQLAGAYAAFANGGYYAKPYTVSRVEYIDSNKTVSLKSKKVKAMSDSTAYMITDTLLYAVEGYSNIGGTVPGVRLGAKTGTSNFSAETRAKFGFPSSANNDMWVTGITPEYAVSMWYGYPKIEAGYYNGSEGYRTRGVLFRQIIDGISTKGKEFNAPNSVVKATIEKETYPGLLPSENTPEDMKVTEYFKKGTEPTEVSERYKTLENPTNLNANATDDSVTLTWNAAKANNYYNQDKLAEMLKGLYKSEAASYASSIISTNGEFGYEVLQEIGGSTTSLGFTTNTKMNVKRSSKDAKYYVRTCYSINRASQSSGISTTVKGKGETKVDDDLVVATLKGDKTDTCSLSSGSCSYSDSGITVTANGQDITNNCTIKVTITPSSSVTSNYPEYTFKEAGNYTVSYSVTYKGKTYNNLETKTIQVN